MESTHSDSTKLGDSSSFGEQAKETAFDVADSLSDFGEQATLRAKTTMNDISGKSKEIAKTYAAEGQKRLDSAEDYVRQHPIRSLMMSAAVGLLISRIVRR